MSFSRSQGVRDSVGMITWAAPGTPAAVLQVNRDRYGTEAFGDPGLLMFRLLRPAFTAGVRAMRDLGSRRAALASLRDGAGAAVVAHDERARQIHVTPQVARLLGIDPQRAVVERAIARLARDLAYRSAAHRHTERIVPARPAAEVRTALGTYTLVAFCVAPGLFGAQPAVMVSLERSRPGMLDDAAVRERFGLTNREVEVARLMATGLSNRAIAGRLGLSSHTVRHHGERLFEKLRVRARADIAAKLQSD
jgi:DNA-binding CsgD family transcriptional regulator